MTGRHVLNSDAHEADPQRGDFWWSTRPERGPVYLLFSCPGCGTAHGVPIAPHGNPGWTWDGNREQPTLTPSIQIVDHGNGNGCAWHGWLRAGEWTDA